MHHRGIVRVGALLAAATLALTACGSRGGDTGTGNTGGKVAKIGVISPLSGDLAAIGTGIRDSVALAIKQANANKAVPGWTLQMEDLDDEAKPDTGKNAATKLANDPAVVGVVGPLNSSVGQSVQPVLSAANIAEISPANTNPTLTQGADWKTSKKRPYANYFRTCTTDAVQGPFAARYVYNTLKFTKVATVHDKKTYGQGLVETFTAEFKKLGGTVVSAQTVNPDDKNYSSVISKIAPSKPQLLYFGGEYPTSGPLTQQMKAAGLNVPLMGGDGMYSADYLKLAGNAAPGNYATSVGAPLDQLPAAKQYIADYKAGGYKGDNSSYGAYAFDAANAIIAALKTSLANAADAKSAREATVKALGSVSIDGVSGKVSFDQYGDTTNKTLTVYQVDKSNAWKGVNTGEFKD
ncbi:branched-chain amino acid ABC transporter substrate-binding protein [Fodinicola acaciae]|uniref:branched-chain amino acid ABC transporter substrate-binding protein n=1 Tax=Fodinicola acaciae TaxID=2681555 RepID=UPI0013D28640|nr:branched-chain amino acid ABC transporter substrate-binding protein [Fodinicola acaciae]